jgi:hypothetical protein
MGNGADAGGEYTVKRMHKALTQYYTETLSHRLPHLSPNLTAIVKDGNRNEAIKVAGILTIPEV